MLKKLHASVLAAFVALVFAPAAFAQTGMVKGKVVDKEGKPLQGVPITIEFQGGINRKIDVKTDRRGEFIQIGLPPGEYKVTATHEKFGAMSQPARVRLGQTAELNFVMAPGAGAPGGEAAAKATELKRLFEEGVVASKSNQYDLAIEKFTAAAGVVPSCYDCYYNIGYAYLQKKDEKQAEASWMKALELKPDYGEALNALSTLYNNQKRFEEAAAMSAKAASAGGTGSADAIYNQGIILWNQGKIPEAKAKFEEALAANPNHPESNFQLGMALVNENKLPEAIAAFEKYLQLAPDGQFAAQAKSLLAALKK